MPGYYYFDYTYLLVLLGVGLCLIASACVNRVMAKYKKVQNSTGITGEEAARRILQNEGIGYVRVECLEESEGDHYDPRTQTVRLSYEVFHGTSVTAVAVAAHECGHAIQHAEEYTPLTIRTTIVPAVNIASKISWPLIALGIFLSWNPLLVQLGIWAFAFAVLFQIITLPVEFNASNRALIKISENGLMAAWETEKGSEVLTAAAFTYVAAALSSLLQLLRLFLLFGRRRR